MHRLGRYISSALQTVNAGVSQAIQTLATTSDQNKTRYFTGIWVAGTNIVAGVQLNLLVEGLTISTIDCTAFSAAFGFIPIYAEVPVGFDLQYQFVNLSGGNLTNAIVSARYQTQPESSPPVAGR